MIATFNKLIIDQNHFCVSFASNQSETILTIAKLGRQFSAIGRVILACLIILSFGTAPCSAAEEILKNSAIIKLQSSDFGDAVIIEKIKTSKCDFDTSIDGLQQLKGAKVSNPVIAAMVATKAPVSSPADSTAKPVLTDLADRLGVSDIPAVNSGEQALQNKIKEKAEGRYKLVTFRKIDGQSAEVFGVKQYVMEYAADIEFLEDCNWRRGYFPTHKKTIVTSSMFPPDVELIGPPVAKGQRFQLSGTIVYEKTERGWGLGEVNLQQVKPLVSSNKQITPALRNLVANDLRIIEGSKDQWALEKGKTTGAIPTEADLAPYFRNGHIPEPPPGGHYIINPVGKPSEISGLIILPQQAGVDTRRQTPEVTETADEKVRYICRNQCIQIRIAGNIWATNNKKEDGDSVTQADIMELFDNKFPSCPAGGTYTIGRVGENATCSISSHNPQ